MQTDSHLHWIVDTLWTRAVPGLAIAGTLGVGLAAGATPEDQEPMMHQTSPSQDVVAPEDPFLWLEEVEGTRALEWARARNADTTAELAQGAGFDDAQARFRTILDSDARIPMVSKRGEYLYNFWRDQDHPRGILRRTTLDSYRTPTPDWELVIDVDQLAESEGENWVWNGSIPLVPDYDRILVKLSRGGADATVIREFDVTARQFAASGFEIPEAKTQVTWQDRDHLYVATDFGPESMSASGYPLTVKAWTRGTPLADATTVFSGQPDDMSAGAMVIHEREQTYTFLMRRITFRTSEVSVLRDGEWVRVDKPADAELETFGHWLLLELRTAWTRGDQTFPAGALVAAPMEDVLAGTPTYQLLFEPTPTTSLSSINGTRNFLILNILDSVRNRLERLWVDETEWHRAPVDVPGIETVSAWGIDFRESDDYWMTRTGFLSPSSLWMGTLGQGAPERVKQLPAYFDTDGLTAVQHHAVSIDGTRVPYFQVCREGLEPTGTHPTLLYGYGGFEISLLPSYSALVGSGWLEQGGVFVIANIRGGGEFGPRWHQAALRENRNKSYEDFIAVAEDLVERGITSPRHLAIRGGSNGGLLMGNMLVMRPDLFGAIVCQVPLLDMQRYHKLLAGASWIEEYGDPDDPAQWEYLQHFSPYHQIRANVAYPRTLFMTSTRDDRVHPAHARKMVARMQDQGHDILYHENIEGGHGGAANNEQVAFKEALVYRFLWQQVGPPKPTKP